MIIFFSCIQIRKRNLINGFKNLQQCGGKNLKGKHWLDVNNLNLVSFLKHGHLACDWLKFSPFHVWTIKHNKCLTGFQAVVKKKIKKFNLSEAMNFKTGFLALSRTVWNIQHRFKAFHKQTRVCLSPAD